jgi:hypothetical protein
MPIKSITTTPAPGFMTQVCAVCGAEHKISFGRGAQKAKKGPYALQVGGTLEIAVDGGAPQTVTFASGDFPDFAAVTTAQLIAKLSTALTGIVAEDDAGGCLIESQGSSPQSQVEVTGGTARSALGFPTDGRKDPSPGRPVLGISRGSPGDRIQDKNVVALRRCNDCGANECLLRTFDVAAARYDGTHFAEHRRSVNALAQHFKAQGWSHPDVANEHAAETSGPPDIDPDFPPGPSAPPPPRPRPEPPTRGGGP